MDSAVVVRTEIIRPPSNHETEKQEANTITLHNNAITRALAHAAKQLGQREYCEGASITLADLAMVSALIYLDLRQPERDWRNAQPIWLGGLLGLAYGLAFARHLRSNCR